MRDQVQHDLKTPSALWLVPFTRLLSFLCWLMQQLGLFFLNFCGLAKVVIAETELKMTCRSSVSLCPQPVTARRLHCFLFCLGEREVLLFCYVCVGTSRAAKVPDDHLTA